MSLNVSSAISYCVWRDSIFDEARELFLVRVLVLFHQVRHVVSHIHAHDVFPMHLCVKLLALRIVAGEAFYTGNNKNR